MRSDYAFSRNFFPTIPSVRHIRFNHEEDLAFITEQTACVILEPVQAEGGIITPQDDYLKKVRERCTQTGTLMILDEIQTGFGRTGYMFAHQKYNIIPDILLIAKGMGGGMPIGALVAQKELMMELARNPALGHITTFGGHPVCVAAALATLNTLETSDHVSEVLQKEKLLHTLLVHPLIQSVRSSGLMMAVQLSAPEYLTPVIDQAIANGVLVDYFLFDDRSFRIAPPLIITETEIREGVSKLMAALDTVHQNMQHL